MKISQGGINLIKRFEGLKLKAYKCSAGVLSIGYGSTKGVYEGMEITEQEADNLLRTDLLIAEGAVDQLVTYPLSQLQFDALVSFVFNCGSGNFKKSTLLKQINRGEILPAAEQFLKWVKAGGKTLPGLVKRREAEREIFLRGFK